MSNVTLRIAGRRYTIACAPGEEEHIETLGARIDGKLAALQNLASQSEARTLLYAALLLADETHEANQRADAAEEAMTQMLEGLAGRLEAVAQRLETPPDNA